MQYFFRHNAKAEHLGQPKSDSMIDILIGCKPLSKSNRNFQANQTIMNVFKFLALLLHFDKKACFYLSQSCDSGLQLLSAMFLLCHSVVQSLLFHGTNLVNGSVQLLIPCNNYRTQTTQKTLHMFRNSMETGLNNPRIFPKTDVFECMWEKVFYSNHSTTLKNALKR
jgi:hypothetical protein